MNAKKKGNKGEHAVAHFLEANGIKAFRNSMSGGSIWKGDIANNLDMCIEVKTVKRLNLLDAWEQVNRDSSKSHAMPILFIHFDNMPKDTWLVTMESGDWVHQIKKANL